MNGSEHRSGRHWRRPDRQEAVPASAADGVRKRCRGRLRPHLIGFQCPPRRPRTCFEGPFGEVIRATGPMAKANPFRFSTKYQDDETDLLYYGYRYYSANVGRWLSRDRIQEDGGLNLFGFSGNSSIDRVHVRGEWHASVHQRMTTQWAARFFRAPYPAAIGDADAGVDNLLSGHASVGPQQSRHMYYRIRGADSRDVWYEDEFANALHFLDLAVANNDVRRCRQAAEAFGRGLHSRQDRSAHRPWPGGRDWSSGRMHPGWWDAWDETEFTSFGLSDVFWRRDINQPPLYFPWADDGTTRLQQRDLQRQARMEVTADSYRALMQFRDAVAGTCICRRAMFVEAR
jgi:RHS repeat-associated protein